MQEPAALGLSSSDAARRLALDGPNELTRAAPASALRQLAQQFESPVVWLLLGACGVSAVLREVADAVAIATIVVINAVVGFVQEHRAEAALLALRSLTAPRARVVRDGSSQIVSASDVVVGDLLLLEAGDIVAADARLVEAHALSANEASLTGESVASAKRVGASPANAPLAERHGALFMGTFIVTGSARAEVSAIAMQTELGKIAHLLTTAQDSKTPLELRLARVSRVLLFICLGIVVAVAILGIAHGVAPFDVFMGAVSLAVAAVPEGLPALVTIALAIGVQRMARQNVLVRRLSAVETLGSATVICTDKTGTLTTGSMEVLELWGPDASRLLRSAAACCDAELGDSAGGGIGDPTELAILRAAEQRSIRRADIERSAPRVFVEPFDADTKRMLVARADGVAYIKGAVEVILPLCREDTAEALSAATLMAGRGLRVLAVAVGAGQAFESLELVGLIAIADPPRPEAIAAVARAHEAGIHVVMITGDHVATARTIARDLGILRPGAIEAEVVHARATPEDKLKIVRAWKSRGAVVAMTGDGVNDAPALREAHIGIAMGRGGTEVTREASDIVLTDDNFASIVAAVREGRGIFDNIKKALVYLLSTNAAELTFMFGAALAGLPIPLLPLHLLWMNLVTDGLPALALVLDPPEADVLQKPPRPPEQPLLGWPEWKQVLAVGLLLGSVAFGVFIWYLEKRELVAARSMAFATLVFSQLFLALAARSPQRVYWQVGPFTNLRLLLVIGISLAAQLALYELAVTRSLFQIGELSVLELAIALALSLIPVSVVEVVKLLRNRGSSAGAAAF